MQAPPAAAEIKSVVVTYPPGIQALDGIDLLIERGTLTALIGANGSGKTTLIRVLAGLLTPARGQVEVQGVDALAQPDKIRGQVGFVSQETALDPEMRGRETLALFASLYGLSRSSRSQRIEELERSFGLKDLLGRTVATYSGGQRRRLHLALSWLTEPQLLLLDEPTLGLDPEGRRLLWEKLVHHVTSGRTAAVASHDLDSIQRHCQKAVILEKGRIVVCDTPDRIRAKHATSRITLRLGTSADAPQLEQKLNSLQGVRAVDIEGHRVRIETAPQVRLQETVVGILQGIGLEVTEIRVQLADLSSAYFNLTGQSLPGQGTDSGRGAARG